MLSAPRRIQKALLLLSPPLTRPGCCCLYSPLLFPPQQLLSIPLLCSLLVSHLLLFLVSRVRSSNLDRTWKHTTYIGPGVAVDSRLSSNTYPTLLSTPAHMRSLRNASAALVVLSLLPAAVLAHGEDHDDTAMGSAMNMGGDHGHAAASDKPGPEDAYPDTYFALADHAGVMYAHIALMILAWIFVLPVGQSISRALRLSQAEVLT